MSFDNTKYDIELNGVPYRVKAYQKGDAQAFVPRVGSGGQTDSEFNLLLSRSIRSFEGGILQRFQDDDTSVFASENLYPIFDDGVLYPVDNFVDPSAVTALIGKANVTATCVTPDYIFIAYQTYNAPANYVKRIDRAGTQQAITLPANMANAARYISDMCFWNDQIWFGVSDGSKQNYLPLTSTSVTEIGSGGFFKMVVLKGSLYGTNAYSTPPYANVLYKYTGSTAATGFTQVGDTGMGGADYNASLLLYNNIIYLARRDGLYAYDGVSLYLVVDTVEQVNDFNFRFPIVLKGYMYYWMPDGFYRFNGSLVEKVYDIQEIGRPVDVTVVNNRLFILYSNSGYSASVSRYDKAMGYNYSSSNNLQGRVAVYNGKALYTYGRTTTFVKNPATADFAGQDEVHRIFGFNDFLYVTVNMPKNAATYYRLSLDELNLTGTKSWIIVTSVDDFGFAMLNKSIENLELVLDGTVVSQSVAIEYRVDGFDGSSGWTSLGSFNTTTALKYFVWQALAAGLSTKRIQFRLAGTTTAGYGIAKFIIRYLLVPELKLNWSFTVLAYGDDSIAPLLLADGSQSSQTVSMLRGNIYAARAAAVPFLFTDLDQLNLNGGINSVVTSITVNTTELLKGSSGFVKVDDEIMYYFAKTGTTLTVLRGVLGTSPASHLDNANVFPVYRVVISQVNPERIIITDDGKYRAEGKARQSEISLVLKEA